jgi:hypothetical integral membrane protein (TIGR02206 family)
MSFFAYESPYRTGNFMELSMVEFTAPFLVLVAFILAVVYYKDTLQKNPSLDVKVRRITGVVFVLIYSSHYLLRFSIYGFDTLILPFQLCSISMFLAILLLFTENRTIYAFTLYAGVLGGLISLFTPIIGYDSHFYRYYQFYGAHILLIVTPLYFLIVKQYYPSKKDTIHAFLILQGLAIFMGVFNYFMGTDFMFIFVDPEKITKFPAIAKFGGIPYYIIVLEIAGILLFTLFYRLTRILFNYQLQNNNIYYKST